MKKEIFGFCIQTCWSDNGLWNVTSKKDGSRHTHLFSIFLVEKEEVTALAIIFLKLSIRIAKLRSPL